MIDFELYRIFVEVAKERNITKASEKLNVSQPAITKQIKNLEEQLSMKLLERKSKGVELTLEGKKLYEKIKKPIEELNTIDRQVCKEKVINIGTHNHIGSCIFGKALNKYYLKYPNVNLNLVCEETSEMMKKLQNEELDIVFSKKDNTEILNGIEYTKLGYLHDVIIASKNSDFANKEVTLDNIGTQIIYTPRKYSQAVKRLETLSLGKKLNLKNSSYNTILELTGSGNALGLITREYVDENDYKKFNLLEVKTTLELGEIEFGIYTNFNKSTELKDLIKMIKEDFLTNTKAMN
jgi:DNA-binding transcriptional LysR family regulator